MVVVAKAIMVRRETVRSCDLGLALGFGIVERRGNKRMDIAYEDEGPWNIISL